MVSVLIATVNDPHLPKTLLEVHETAHDEIEFIIVNDGGEDLELQMGYTERDDAISNVPSPIAPFDYTIITHNTTKGRRVSFNEAARIAKGEYVFILDSHCKMSDGWDVKMQESCIGNNLVHCVIRDMDPETWEYKGGHYLHVYLNQDYTEKWWNLKPLSKCEIEEENMCLTGCAWMVSKDGYWRMNGYDESLGKYGWDGPEWACKVWVGDTPGKVILRTDVICGHIFGTNFGGTQYKCEMIPKADYIAYMKNLYADRIDKLTERFKPVPGWHKKEKPMAVKDGTGREVKLERQKEKVTRNEQGEIIKKVIEYYEYVFCDDGSGPSEKEILEAHRNDLKLVREEVWTLQDGQLKKTA